MESRESYSIERIEELYEYLTFQSESGQPVDYEIRIDHLIAVRRTSDPERFHDFEPQLKETTSELRIVMFKGTSRKSDIYCFVLREIAEPQSFQQQLEQAVKREKEALLIRLEMDYLQRKIKDQKQMIKDLKRALEKAGTGNDGMANMLKELSTSPLVKDLFKGKAANNDQAALGALPDEEVMKVIQHYRSEHGEETFQELLGTMLAMAQSPKLIPQVRKFITSQTDKS
jgi:hypothetical protein